MECSISVSRDGETVAIGIPGETSNYVRVYKSKKGKWVQRGPDFEGLGYMVSLSKNGRILAIGQSYEEENIYPLRGEIRIFEYKAEKNEWNEVGTFEGGSPSSFFETSSSLSGNGRVLAIGASGHDHFNITDKMGSVRVYHRPFQNKTTVHGKDIFL